MKALKILLNLLWMSWLASAIPMPEGVFLGLLTAVLVGSLAVSAASSAYSATQGSGGGPSGAPGSVKFDLEDLTPIFTGPQVAEQLLHDLFLSGGTGPKTQKEIKKFLRFPRPLTAAESGAIDLAADVQQDYLPGALDFLRLLQPTALDLVQTGIPTAIDPIIERERFRLQTDTAPALAEMFAGTTGVNSSDFSAALAREGERLGADLGALQFNADEAATARRLSSLPVAAELAGFGPTLATNIAAATQAIGERGRLAQESVRPGGRLLAALQTLTGLETQQQFLAPFFPGPQGAGSGVIGGGAAESQGIGTTGAILGGLGQFLGGLGGVVGGGGGVGSLLGGLLGSGLLGGGGGGGFNAAQAYAPVPISSTPVGGQTIYGGPLLQANTAQGITGDFFIA